MPRKKAAEPEREAKPERGPGLARAPMPPERAQALYLLIASGKTPYQACKELGYAHPKQSYQDILKSKTFTGPLRKAFVDLGGSAEFLMASLFSLSEAKMVQPLRIDEMEFDAKGKPLSKTTRYEFNEVPDNRTRKDAIELICRIMGGMAMDGIYYEKHGGGEPVQNVQININTLNLTGPELLQSMIARAMAIKTGQPLLEAKEEPQESVIEGEVVGKDEQNG